MKYSDLLTSNKIVFVKESNLFDTGYHIYDRYVMEHLGLDREYHSVGAAPKEQWSKSLTPPIFKAVTPLDEIEDPATEYKGAQFIISLPINASEGVMRRLYERLPLENGGIAVLHDIAMFEPAHYHNCGWHGGYEREAFYSMMRGNLLFLNHPNIKVVVPSRYMLDRYKGFSLEHKVNEALYVPHPMRELLKPWLAVKPVKWDKTVVVSTPYKSNQMLLWTFIEGLRRAVPDVRIIIPNSNQMLDPEHYKELVLSKQVELLESCTHHTMLDTLRRAIVYADFSQYQESFGFMVREALALGTKVALRPMGALGELNNTKNLHYWFDVHDAIRWVANQL